MTHGSVEQRPAPLPIVVTFSAVPRASPSYIRLKNMVKKFLVQVAKDRNFDSRIDWVVHAASIRWRSDDRNESEDEKLSTIL